jgi:hypothetical protein
VPPAGPGGRPLIPFPDGTDQLGGGLVPDHVERLPRLGERFQYDIRTAAGERGDQLPGIGQRGGEISFRVRRQLGEVVRDGDGTSLPGAGQLRVPVRTASVNAAIQSRSARRSASG